MIFKITKKKKIVTKMFKKLQFEYKKSLCKLERVIQTTSNNKMPKFKNVWNNNIKKK